jgi:predicted ATPase with chaperone activity
MLYKTLSAAVYGIDANIIEVEVDVSGIKCREDHFHTVGLPDAAVRESRDRVGAALRNRGYDIPLTHITVNLAPADIKKEGFGFELPMALGILGAYGGLNKEELSDCLFVGELSLDGGVRDIPRPGEVSLSHNGVRFLNELPEFPRNVLEVMRPPLEDGTVRIARAAMSLTFPARFLHSAAMSPCPCGFFNDCSRDCRCNQPMIQRYMQKSLVLSWIALTSNIDVPAMNYKEMRSSTEPQGSALIRDRVMRARHPAEKVRFVHPYQNLLQRPDDVAPDSYLLRTFKRLRAPAGTRHDAVGTHLPCPPAF